MLLSPLSLFAQTADVTCWQNSCLKNGWTWSSGYSKIDYGCYRDGCETSGWVLSAPNRSYTQCKSMGCFLDGWYQVSLDTQNLEKEIVCKHRGPELNCLKYGWTAYARAEGQLFTITCKGEDCLRRGWTVQFIDGRIIQVSCKAGGCFTTGWVEN